MKNWIKAIESDLNQVKNAGTLLWCDRQGREYLSKDADLNPVLNDE